jgi:small subunit ribosomal protein S2
MSNKIDFKTLINAGVQFGHQTARWCPKMAPYIWGYKNNIHLIDVSKTAYQLERAGKFLETVAAEGKTILWVGTKKPAQEIIFTAAVSVGMPYVNHRWIGGTLSNHGQVKKSVTKLLHYEDIVSKSELYPQYTKKEFNVFQKMIYRLQKNVGGIKNLQWPVGAIVLVDVTKERSALKEAANMGIPVVAIVDTNGDPSLVDYVIPANDDVPRSIKVIIDFLSQAVQHGKSVALAQGKEKQARQETEGAQGMDESVALVLATEDEEETAGKLKRKAVAGSEEGLKKKLVKKPTGLVEEDEGSQSSKSKVEKPTKSMPKTKAAEKSRSGE